ncbi:MAG: glycosyltransferase family 9 protein [Nanoarchaeota archaeon]|nr:glycosyltransferase family 9 protein [Nanoarchaeota archaeon]
MEKKQKILIIKTGYSEFLDRESDSRNVSLGDILRITPLLHLYKNDDVTWVSDKYAFPLLKENPYINRLIHLDWIAAEQLKSEEFDTVINLEKIPGICALSDNIRARRSRYGFTFDSQTGKAEAYEKAIEVLAVSSDPKIKKENTRLFQELLFEMVGQKWDGEESILGYKPKKIGEYDIGLNTKVGLKWPTKAWASENWDKLEEKLKQEGFKTIRQDKQGPEILNNIYSYIDWINSCDTLVTGDTLGMHLGIALHKKVLALFGPTPHKEVYFYGKGKVILPEPVPDCLPCFGKKCERGKSCMEDITMEKVYEEI